MLTVKVYIGVKSVKQIKTIKCSSATMVENNYWRVQFVQTSQGVQFGLICASAEWVACTANSMVMSECAESCELERTC